MRRLLFSLVLAGVLFSQAPADLVEKCSLKVEAFALSREVFPRLAVGSIRNHSLRPQGFVENLYELITSRLSDYLMTNEGVLGFDSRGGFFSPPPGYDYLLKIIYKEIAGEAHLFIRIYSRDGKLQDFVSCSARVEDLPYREFEISSPGSSPPMVLWDAQVPGRPLAVLKNGEDIFILYPDKLLELKKVGGILKEVKRAELTWPGPLYPSQDLRGFIKKVSLQDGVFINVGISSSSSYLYLKYEDLSPAMVLPWLVLSGDGEKLLLGRFVPGKNHFDSTLAEVSLPAGLQDLTLAEPEKFPPFYDVCLYQNLINIVDEEGRRRVFRDDQEIPSPRQPLGDEVECWGGYFVFTGFDGKEKVGFQDFSTFEKRGVLDQSGRIIYMGRTESGTVMILEEEASAFWIKEIKIE